MAGSRAPRHTIIEDEDEFLEDVEAYMKQRGVPFEREGKVAGRSAPLHKLYRLVMERGGYDAVTATRMSWRELCRHFNLPAQHEGAMSYQLKQLFYKNLAAYEIETYWGEQPPPPDKLEQLTAKGGDLRKRMHDNSAGSAIYDDQDTDRMVIDEPQQTPKQEKVEPDDQGSASRYPSRLRQQPKPVQLYQPEPNPSRGTRAHATNSPQPAASVTNSFVNASSDPRNPHFKIENYEPRPAVPLGLRPVMTPGSNPDLFCQRKAMAKLAPVQRIPQPQDLLRSTLPKVAFDGPNIYVRCVQGLKSGIPSEQQFALHHLVKVSYERGDRFKFEGFPTLAEALLEKIVQITQLAFNETFHVSYMEAKGMTAPNTINAVHGTEGLRQKLANLTLLLSESEIEPEGYHNDLERLNEATLVLRNMLPLEENAVFMSKMLLLRDVIVVLLNLPRQSRFNEIRQYALDMAEMMTRFWELKPDDELYLSLLTELESEDRGKIISSLKAIWRFDAEADRVHQLHNISLSTIEKLVHYCVLEDDELVEQVINILYAWTATQENITCIMKESPSLFPSITLRLSNLLLNGAIEVEESVMRPKDLPTPTGPVIPPTAPMIPQELYRQLLGFAEPDRAVRWLRCCFESVPGADVTQISIWQAYQQRFIHDGHIPAAEFIKTVGTTLTGAAAQVVTGPNGQQRFIIRGIRPRRVLVDLRGQPFYKCQWEAPFVAPPSWQGPPPKVHVCGSWHSNPEALWKHLLVDHAQIPRQADGRFLAKDIEVPRGGFKCRWIGCRKNNAIDSAIALARHLRLHVPENAEQNEALICKLANEPKKPQDDSIIKHVFYASQTDERGWPLGIPFVSALLLCNLARYVGRCGGNEKERKLLMGRLFGPQVRQNLWDMFSKQRTIAKLIVDLIDFIEKGEAAAKKPHPQQDEGRNTLF